jgi:hypothetical protein
VWDGGEAGAAGMAKTIATVLGGARACPPEDCGGIPGYYNLVEAMTDPGNPEYARLLEWMGEPFDAEFFDLRKADAAVRRAARPRKKRMK